MLEKFERYPLMFGPTPIEKLSRLSERLAEPPVGTARRQCRDLRQTR